MERLDKYYETDINLVLREVETSYVPDFIPDNEHRVIAFIPKFDYKTGVSGIPRFFGLCKRCGGKGYYTSYGLEDDREFDVTCASCNGKGKIIFSMPKEWGGRDVGIIKCERKVRDCSLCRGYGIIVALFPRRICEKCGGSGGSKRPCEDCGGVGSIYISDYCQYLVSQFDPREKNRTEKIRKLLGILKYAKQYERIETVSWAYIQLAEIHHKEKKYADEISALEGYEKLPVRQKYQFEIDKRNAVLKKLKKARQLLDEQLGKPRDTAKPKKKKSQPKTKKLRLNKSVVICNRCGMPPPTVKIDSGVIYKGVRCSKCKKVECLNCKGIPPDRPCSWCGGKVSPIGYCRVSPEKK